MAEIEAQHQAPAAMRCDEGGDGAAVAIAVRRGVWRDQVEELMQETPLQGFQPRFRHFQEPALPRRLGQDAVGVMAHAPGGISAS